MHNKMTILINKLNTFYPYATTEIVKVRYSICDLLFIIERLRTRMGQAQPY